MKKIDETFMFWQIRPIHAVDTMDEKPKAVLQIIHGMVACWQVQCICFLASDFDRYYVALLDMICFWAWNVTPDDYGGFGDHGNET